MHLLLQQVVDGMAIGTIYAALALALVMVYQSTHLVNFFQGEMAMFSTYIAWSFLQRGVPLVLTILVTLALSFLGGVAIERLVIRRFKQTPVLSVVIVLLGLLISFNSLAGGIWDYTTHSFPSMFPRHLFPANRYASNHELGMFVVVMVLLSILYAFFRFTTLGLAMRAAAENSTSSRLVGIRVDRMVALGWGLAAILGTVAGLLIAPILYLDPNMMSSVMVYAFAGALVGGISNPLGAVIGGLLMGVLENLLGAYVVGQELKLCAAFVIIITVLWLRPAGLLGRAVINRV